MGNVVEVGAVTVEDRAPKTVALDENGCGFEPKRPANLGGDASGLGVGLVDASLDDVAGFAPKSPIIEDDVESGLGLDGFGL